MLGPFLERTWGLPECVGGSESSRIPGQPWTELGCQTHQEQIAVSPRREFRRPSEPTPFEGLLAWKEWRLVLSLEYSIAFV